MDTFSFHPISVPEYHHLKPCFHQEEGAFDEQYDALTHRMIISSFAPTSRQALASVKVNLCFVAAQQRVRLFLASFGR